ncbi:MAG: hypothetical protein HY809_00025 [Nitrospirae bacterium]|nr:hypothetical protein [Nitrospirota bacterium]
MNKEHIVKCRCGKYAVAFQFKDNIMPHEVIQGIFCPSCSKKIAFDPISMIETNGWIIHYNMFVASRFRRKLPAIDMDNLLPEMLFDKGYATWLGLATEEGGGSLMDKCECGALLYCCK